MDSALVREIITLMGGVAMSSNGDGMLANWERKILLDKLHGIEVKPEHLRAVKYRIKKRLEQAFRDLQLIRAVFPEVMRGVGFPPRFTGNYP